MPTTAGLDPDRCYRVTCSRDGRFDGTFVTAVLTTGIYCRPSCPALTPRRDRVRFYPTPAAAQESGFRACKRCRPDAAPGSPEWDGRADVVARAVRLIGDGTVEREGVEGLARKLGYSARHLHRLMSQELGAGPLRLAMAHRVQAARTLLEATDLPVTEVAWAAGFASIRQFNDLVRRVYASTPSELRRRGSTTGPSTGPSAPVEPSAGAAVVVRARLAYRPPLDAGALLDFLGARAVPGVEAYDGSTYTAALRLSRGMGVVRVPRPRSQPARAGSCFLDCEFRLDDVRDYASAVSRLRRLLDLDADPAAVAAALGEGPILADLVRAAPGRRMPGTADPHELALRAVLGQQVTLASARAAAGRLAERFGEPLPSPVGEVVRAFPTPAAIAAALAVGGPGALPLPRARAQALGSLAAALASGDIDLHPGADRAAAEAALLAVPGVGPWTAAYIRMRGFGDPDVLPPGDAAIRRALASVPAGVVAAAAQDPATWSPWRSYATAHLWAAAGRLVPLPPTGPHDNTSASTGPKGRTP